MMLHEVSWIRSSSKLCPALKKAALGWYSPLKYVPCFIQKPLKFIKQHWRKVPVIVQIDEKKVSLLSAEEITAFAGCSIQKQLKVINAFSTRVNAKSLSLLENNHNVKRIWLDREIKAVLDVASPTIQAPPVWEQHLTGKGVTVAVLDSGIYNHPDLAGRIKGFVDLVKQKTSPYDDNGHGTHVAGDIASNGSQSDYLYRGPAPEADLVGVKVLNKMGSGSFSTVIEGIQWCIDNRDYFNIKVLNISLGAAAHDSYRNDPVCQVVEKAWEAGIVVCAAAGNEGPQSKTINTPGIDPLIITVGALDDKNTLILEDDLVNDFSSRGPTIDNLTKPDIVSPGTNIISLRSPGSMLDKQNREARVGNWYISFSGTSMATPVCCGVVAQMLQADNYLTPEQVKTRLMQSARKLDGYDPNVQGMGVIDARRAVGFTAALENKLDRYFV
ncbi:serine protease AprX [Desulfotomaculum arcticum]|uniref:Serine protease AprX n=1 Tax=Desulfotruncus arcticus DSM 17038 TaxID=1121424 RepID=A0A1I2VJU1_9FIRM|nr:S8 family peptidase [Desulfotruncus arcticus]SFG88497.1 serine protease AprX [Desulfotomaculum arcticum] [Desulfotruncus arcticus DSM 17038]